MRKGVVFQDEQMMEQAIAKGESWDKVHPRLDEGTDLEYVKKHLWEPMQELHKLAEKAGHKTISAHRRAIGGAVHAKLVKDEAAKKKGTDDIIGGAKK